MTRKTRVTRQRTRTGFAPFPDLPSDPEGVLDRWLESLHVWPLGAYECFTGVDWHFGPRTKSETIFFRVVTGGMTAEIGVDRERHGIGRDEVLLVPRSTPFALRARSNEGLHFITVHFHATASGIDLMTLLGFPSVIPCPAGAPYPGIAGRVAREYGLMAPGWRQVMRAEITRLLCHIVRHHGSLLRSPATGTATRELPRLMPALKLIDRRLDDPRLSVAELAEAVFVSEVYLRKLFRNATGLSPVDFVQKRRVMQASSLLRMSDAGTKEIARRCGFSELSFFYRVFRKWTGTTPGRFRRESTVDTR